MDLLEKCLTNEINRKINKESKLNTLKNFKTNIWEFPEFNYAEIVLLDNLSNVINMYQMSIKESESLIEMYKTQLTYQANINQVQ